MQNRYQHIIALVISAISIAGIVILSIVLLSSPEEDTRALTIFNAILPMVGTWIGAIIAYYFGTKQIETIQNQQEVLANTLKEQVDFNTTTMQNMQGRLNTQLDELIQASK